jgi:hypothetical protein
MYTHLRTKTYKTPSYDRGAGYQQPKFVAVWLDHKHARVISLLDDTITSQTIDSGLPRKRRSTGGVRSGSSFADFSLSSEHNEHQWRQEMTKKYFEKITAALEGAKRVVLLGPGPMKRTLLHILQQNKSLANRLDQEPITVGKLTDPQLERLVREYFLQIEPERQTVNMV